jgi:diguanylate cyclase (GGDEF)-like protein
MESENLFNRALLESWLNDSQVCRKILDSVCDIIVVLDDEDRVIYSVTPFSLKEHTTITADFFTHIDPSHLLDVKSALETVSDNHHPTFMYRYRFDNEKWVWHESVGLVMRAPQSDVSYRILLIKDITQKKEEEDALRQLAFHDALTGLPNRRIFHEHVRHTMAQSKRSGQSMALLSIDVDNFKWINDTMGHHVGDQFLIYFATRVRGCVREVDMLARISGDEFMVLLPTVDSKEGAEKVSQRIMDVVKAPWSIESFTFNASVSMGIALYPSNGSDMETLFKHVDTALYKAKNQGKMGYVFYRD